MDRAYFSNTSAVPPSPPAFLSLGFPTSGSPAEGVPASRLGPYWYHMITESLRNVILAADLDPDAKNLTLLTAAIAKIANSGNRFPCLKSGEELPDTNVGPIWHDDYNSIMTWQIFDAHGAEYEGYASILIGSPLFDAQPTPRVGYIPSGFAGLGRVAYAALRNWAIHVGNRVAPSAWKAGEICVKDNDDGLTFTLYDLRGRFPRAWGNGSSVDPGRAFGTAQEDAIRNITGTIDGSNRGNFTGGSGALAVNGVNSTSAGYDSANRNYPGFTFDASRVVPVAAENLVKNTALPLYVKY